MAIFKTVETAITKDSLYKFGFYAGHDDYELFYSINNKMRIETSHPYRAFTLDIYDDYSEICISLNISSIEDLEVAVKILGKN